LHILLETSDVISQRELNKSEEYILNGGIDRKLQLYSCMLYGR